MVNTYQWRITTRRKSFLRSNATACASNPPYGLVNSRRIKLKYAHQGGRNPPTVIIHGVQTDALPIAYKRYLVNFFRTQLQLQGTPIRLEFKSPANPFHGRKNKLTERQIEKRKRLIEHRRKK